jgi:hypothetical protein
MKTPASNTPDTPQTPDLSLYLGAAFLVYAVAAALALVFTG